MKSAEAVLGVVGVAAIAAAVYGISTGLRSRSVAALPQSRRAAVAMRPEPLSGGGTMPADIAGWDAWI